MFFVCFFKKREYVEREKQTGYLREHTSRKGRKEEIKGRKKGEEVQAVLTDESSLIVANAKS